MQMNRPYTKHPCFYKDAKYMIIRVDPLNFALVNTTKYGKYGVTEISLYGYYSNLKASLEQLLLKRGEDQLLVQVQTKGPFKSLEVLVTAVIEHSLTMPHEFGKISESSKLEKKTKG